MKSNGNRTAATGRASRKGAQANLRSTELHLPQETRSSRIGRWTIRFALGLCSSLVFAWYAVGLLDLGPQPLVFALAIVAAVAEALLSLQPTVARGANIAAAIAAVVACVMRPGLLFDGFPLMLNRAFELSAAHQAYQYEFFPVGLDADASAMALCAAVCFVVTVAALGSCFALMQGKAVGVLVVSALLVTAQSYLGVPAPAGANAALAAACISCLALCHSRQNAVPLEASRLRAQALRTLCGFGCALALIALCWIAYPAAYHDDNPAVHAVNEQMRDQVAGGESIASALAESLAGGMSSPPPSGEQAQGVDDVTSPRTAEQAPSASLQRISSLEWWEMLLAILLVVLCALAIAWAVKRALVRKRFRDADCSVALEALFRHMMRVLHLVDVKPGNTCFSQAADQVERQCGDEAADSYRQAVGLWRRLRYSSDLASAEDVQVMEAQVATVKQLSLSSMSPVRRMAVRLLCYNRN